MAPTACRDCKNCTNSAIANAGRKTGRWTAGIATVGMSELAMVTKKKCRASGHQMSLRGVDQVAGAVQPTVQVQGTPVAAAPAEPKGPGLMRRLAEQGQQLAEHQQGGVPAATPSAAPAAPVPPPPPPAVPAGWYPDPNGALLQRYWDGAAWTEYTAPMVPGQ